MIKGYKVEILPNKEQQEKIIKFCHAARYAYNWAIALEKENYENGFKFLSGYDLNKAFTQFKNQEENKWLKEISARALKVSILNAASAYENFFKKRADYPKFKSKKHSKMKCATHESSIKFDGKKVRLEKLGWVKLARNNYVPFGDDVKYYNPKIEFDGLRFYVSVSIESDDIPPNYKDKTEAIGVDLGIKTLATCSNGIVNQKPNIKNEQKKLKRLQRKASKHYTKMINDSKQTKVKFDELQKSKNLIKLEKDILKIHKRIRNILSNNIHQFTSELIKLNPEAIVIEDLNVSGMRKNKHFSKLVNEAKFYEIRSQFTYKCKRNNIKLIIADRWYPSSKTCSCCGYKKEKLSLSERTFICEECGFEMDRDLNASINLKNLSYAT